MYGKVDVIIGWFFVTVGLWGTPFVVNVNIMLYQKAVPKHLIFLFVCFGGGMFSSKGNKNSGIFEIKNL